MDSLAKRSRLERVAQAVTEDAVEHPLYEVNIALVGKYVDLTRNLINRWAEALIHAGMRTPAPRCNIH